MQTKQVYSFYDRKEKHGENLFRYCPYCGMGLVLEQSESSVKRPTCPGCGFVQYRNPSPTVSALVVDQDRTLLGRRSGEPGAGKWALPSRYVEWEEDYLSTGIKEVKEETGLDVCIDSVLNVVSSFLTPNYHFLALFLLARVIGGQAVAGDDLAEIAWYPLSGPLPDMAFEEDVDMIEQYASGAVRGLPVDGRFSAARE